MINRINIYFFIASIFCIVLFLLQCTPAHDKKRNDLHAELLREAKSISTESPAKADSLYRIVAGGETQNISENYIDAVTGIADIFIANRAFDSAALYLQKAEISLSGDQDSVHMIPILNIKGKMYYQEGRYDSAEYVYRKGLSLVNLTDDSIQKTAFTLNLGKSILGSGNYTDAAKLLDEGLKMAISNQNNVHIMVAFHSLAVLYSAMNQYDEAIKYTKRHISLALTIPDSHSYANAMMNLGIYYKNSGLIDSALLAYTKASDAYSILNDSLSMIMTLYNKGILLKKAGKYIEAEKTMKYIYNYCKDNNMPEGQTYSLTALAGICEETNRKNEGLVFINTALSLATKHNLIINLSTLYERKHSLLATLGMYEEAYLISLQAVKISDSLSGLEVKKEILELKTKYESEEKEAENHLLKKDNQIINSRLVIQKLALAVTLLLVSISVLLFLLYRKKIRHRQALAEEKAIRLENENKAGILALEHSDLRNKLKQEELNRIHIENQLKSEQIENLELQTSLKEQELVFQALARAELTQLLQKISEKLHPFKIRLHRKKDQEEFSHVLTGISRDSAKDPLSEFELLFRQLHPEFYEKLLNRCPQLSKSELHISAMIRLNLSTKDMASLVNLSISTIETNRYHIRKKLSLDQGENLTTCLMQV
jgi:tetratricopeptide (TPR) repeat protein